ncbi:hypothetical protein [Photobacterium sp. GB-36]|uniref:hypothetical protein n=1 Tax=Photobacterium sp. GB-36 TaxID=2022108 RepID=UPI000D4ED3B9|nr:hypothetical protein [Photobacterium sp. GB-36]PSV41880.1 hypothetical protein C9J46_15835 [Photobacterium sp. GB-36]
MSSIEKKALSSLDKGRKLENSERVENIPSFFIPLLEIPENPAYKLYLSETKKDVRRQPRVSIDCNVENPERVNQRIIISKCMHFHMPVLEEPLNPTYKGSLSETKKDIKIKILEEKVKELEEKLKLYEHQSKSIETINKIKNEYLKQMVQSSEFGNYLSCTRQNINRLRREHKILAVSGKNGNYFPLWQLDENNEPYSCIPSVIDAIGFDNQWTIVQFFHSKFELIGNKTPIEYLKTHPGNEPKISKLARQYVAN